MKWKIKSRLDEKYLVLDGWNIYFSVDRVSYRAFLYNCDKDDWSVIVLYYMDLVMWKEFKSHIFRTRLSIVQFIDEVIFLVYELENEIQA